MNKILGAISISLATVTTTWAQTWDMPTPYGDTTFHTQNIRQFAEDVSAATNGELQITVHSAGSLFPHAEIKNAVRSGQVQVGEFFLSRIVNENAAFGLDSQPFLATSYEDAEALWAEQREVVIDLLANQRLVPLFSVPWPAQGLYTRAEIETVDDLKGLRFRAYNAALEQFASLAGAAPVQVEAPNIPQAFATGQVEAMITSPSTGANSAAWDFLTHYTPINAWLPKNIVVVNRRAFDSLSEDVQAAVLEAAAAAEARGWELSQAEAAAKTQVLADNGIVVYEPSAELVAGLEDIGATMQADLEANASPEALAVINSL